MNKELITELDPKSRVSESIKTIRTNLQFSNVDDKVKSILMTSSIPGEGKSFISANLAIAFAQKNNRVLIVDADMRKGRVHRIFDVTNEKGLSELLISNVEKEYKKYIKETKVKNVYVITGGLVPPNPSELLDSDNNKKLLEILENNFDYIIYDGTPIDSLTDSLIMSRIVDKVVIVCSMKLTPMETLMQTKKSIENVGGKIAGVVVNRIENKKKKYSNYYYYGD